jgi:hypothetical protein
MNHSTNVLSFFSLRKRDQDWSQRELAEFYRVESALVQAGMSVWTDRGVTDEGEPWFVFGRADNEEVIAHFARIGGEYVIVSSVFPAAATGADFHSLVRELLSAHPYVVAKNVGANRQQNVFLHPAALLTALLATAFAKTAELNDHAHSDPGEGAKDQWSFLHRFELALISAIALVVATAGEAADATIHRADLAELNRTESELRGSSKLISGEYQDANLDPDPSVDESLRVALVDQRALLPNQAFLWGNGVDPNDGLDSPLQEFVSTMVALQAQVENGSVVLKRADDVPGFDIAAKAAGDNTHDAAYDQTWNLEEAGLITIGTIEGTTRGDDTIEISSKRSSIGDGQPSASEPVNEKLAAINDGSDSVDLATSLLSAASVIALPSTTLDDAIQSSLSLVGYSRELAPLEIVDIAEIDFDHIVVSVDDHVAVTPAASVQPANSDDAMRDIIDAFVRNTPKLQVSVYGDDVVMVDADTKHMLSGYELMTWHLADGSSISIVGIISPHDALAA